MNSLIYNLKIKLLRQKNYQEIVNLSFVIPILIISGITFAYFFNSINHYNFKILTSIEPYLTFFGFNLLKSNHNFLWILFYAYENVMTYGLIYLFYCVTLYLLDVISFKKINTLIIKPKKASVIIEEQTVNYFKKISHKENIILEKDLSTKTYTNQKKTKKI